MDEQERIETVAQQSIAEYAGVRARITEAWGPADYAGQWGDEGFPEWGGATLLTCWRRGDATAYVEYRHDDKELPMMVVLGVRR